jgi:hypothetical protein
MPTVARTSGGEVVRRPEDGADRLGGELGGTGVWHGWGRKTERIGSGVGGLRLLKVLRCAGQRGKAEGGPGVDAAWREGSEEERGGSGRDGGQLEWPASAPGQWARVAALLHDIGGRRGAGDAGASGWVREGVRESGAAR